MFVWTSSGCQISVTGLRSKRIIGKGTVESLNLEPICGNFKALFQAMELALEEVFNNFCLTLEDRHSRVAKYHSDLCAVKPRQNV